jgi:hypothetical protein
LHRNSQIQISGYQSDQSEISVAGRDWAGLAWLADLTRFDDRLAALFLSSEDCLNLHNADVKHYMQWNSVDPDLKGIASVTDGFDR